MSKILELREKRAKAWEAAKAFLDSKRGSDGLVSAEDAVTYDRMEEDIVNLGKEIARLERQEALEAELNKPVNMPLTGKPNIPGMETKTGRASDDYKKAFWNVMRSKNPRHDVLNSLSVGTDSEGGYLVPDEFERTLIQTLEEENVFRKLAKIIQTSSGDRKIPVVVTKGTAAWLDEGEEFDESDSVFGQTSIGAYKLGTMIKVSDELLNDSVFNLESYISTEFARRIGAKEEEAFLVGDADGKPQAF
jgi:HK97 family phage major capsid protein